jgi:hypothetical protein
MWRGGQFPSKRTIGLLIVLLITVLSQWSAWNAEYQQHRSEEHCCLLCHIGPHASLDAIAPILRAPELFVAWIAPPAEATSPREASVSRSSSRAPPVSSLS